MLILNGCGKILIPVDIKDEALYYLKGPSGAVEMHFLTSGQTDLTLDQWNAISEGMVCMELSSWDDFNTEIGKLCSQIPCDYQTVEAFKKIIARLHVFNATRTDTHLQ